MRKKIFTLLMTLVIVIGLSMTVFADGTNEGSPEANGIPIPVEYEHGTQ